MRRVAFGLALLLLLLAGCETFGQIIVTQLTPMDWNGQEQIVLPLSVSRSGHISVPVRIVDHEASAFIDTGAPLPTISRHLADAAGLKLKGTMKVNGEKFPAAEDVRLQLGAASFELGLVTVHDYRESQFVFGGGLFFQAVVDMDLDAGRLTLIHPDAFTDPAQEPVRTGRWKMRPTVEIKVNGLDETICAAVDTGFDGGVALAPSLVKKLALPQQRGRVDTRVRFDGSKIEAPALQPLTQLRIGEQVYENVSVVGVVPYEAGDCSNLVGMEVLARHRVIFDVRRNRAWFLPREGDR